MSNTPYFDAYERTRASRNRVGCRTTSDNYVAVNPGSTIQYDDNSVVSYPFGSGSIASTGFISNIRVTTPARTSLIRNQREYRLNKRYTEVSGPFGPVRVLSDATLVFRDSVDGTWIEAPV